MTEILTLPMLPLDDVVVLPGMVVPLSLSESEVRAAVEAAPENCTLADLDRVLCDARLGRRRSRAAVAWLLKYGLLEITRARPC